MDEDADLPVVGVAFENVDQPMADALLLDLTTSDPPAPALLVVAAVHGSLRPQDLSSTRVVFTGDLAASVHNREPDRDKPYTLERGAGIVAAKTMRPDADGMVDILVPVYWLLQPASAISPGLLGYVTHVAAHEAIHATLFHIGGDPFDAHLRKKFGAATLQFVAMASEQIEEHLAEVLSATRGAPRGASNADTVREAFDAFQRTLSETLPAIPTSDPDYFRKGMFATFEALHIVWKTLAYLAAELRQGDSFKPVPAEIAKSPAWGQWVAQWWPGYVERLGQIPMSVDVDVPATDEVVESMASHLQAWAYGIGFDYHDTDDGENAFFRIMI